MDSNDVALRDLPEALACQQPDGQRSHAVTLRDTHSDISMKGRAMSEQPMAYEEVFGSRTLQQAVEQPQRERWAYEELRPGDVIQEGDEWQNPDGRWHPLVLTPEASMEVRDVLRARRPYKISTILEIGNALANAQKAATQLQDERDNALAALKSAQRTRDELQMQVDELRADRRDEPTARQVQEVLRRWATELDWSADCFGSAGREQVHGVQNTLIAVMQRIESMIDTEGSRAND